MNITVYQQITINTLRVNSISNSSVLQIGSSGSIQALANLYNTGEFTKPAEEADLPGEYQPLIPLSSLT